jgi:hypothetical protein
LKTKALPGVSEDGWTRWRDGMSALAQQPNMNADLGAIAF